MARATFVLGMACLMTVAGADVLRGREGWLPDLTPRDPLERQTVARRLLAAAEHVANADDPATSRNRSKIARAWYLLGERKRALTILGGAVSDIQHYVATNPLYYGTAISEIAESYVFCGAPHRAVNVATLLPANFEVRRQSLMRACRALADEGSYEDALVLVKLGCFEPDVRAAVAVGHARNGAFERALELAGALDQGKPRSRVLAQIGSLAAIGGLRELASQTLVRAYEMARSGGYYPHSYDDMADVAVRCERAGFAQRSQRYFAVAERAARKLPVLTQSDYPQRSEGLVAVATRLIEAQRRGRAALLLKAARENLEPAGASPWVDSMLPSIIIGLARAHEFDEACRLADLGASRRRRGLMQVAIAGIYVDTGRRREGVQLIQEVLTTPEHDPSVVAQACPILARAGLLKGALERVAKLDPFHGTPALVSLAEWYLKSGPPLSEAERDLIGKLPP